MVQIDNFMCVEDKKKKNIYVITLDYYNENLPYKTFVHKSWFQII